MSITSKDIKITENILPSSESKTLSNLLSSDGLVLNLKSNETIPETDPQYFDITLTIEFLQSSISHNIVVNKAGSSVKDFVLETESYQSSIVYASIKYSNSGTIYSLGEIFLSEFYVDEESQQTITCKDYANVYVKLDNSSNFTKARGVATYTTRRFATLDNIMNKLSDVYYPVGHYVITSTNTNPNNLGIKGTWELKSKTLRPDLADIIGNTFFTANSTNFTKNSFRVGTDGSTIYCVLYGYNKVALSDTDVNIGTLNYDVLGTQVNSYANYGAGYANSREGAVIYSIVSSSSSRRTCNFNITDVITRSSGGTIAAQSSGNIFIPFTLILTTNDGLYFKDELCSEFHWLRTA